jgi:hypothetical protein
MKFTIRLKSLPPPPSSAAAPAPPPPPECAAGEARRPSEVEWERRRASGFESALSKAEQRKRRPAETRREAEKTESAGNVLQLVQTLQLACLCGGVVAEHEVRELLRTLSR